MKFMVLVKQKSQDKVLKRIMHSVVTKLDRIVLAALHSHVSLRPRAREIS